MRTLRMLRVSLAAACVLLVGSGLELAAQTACRTANCALSGTPPTECTNRAAPRTLRSVSMEGDLFSGFVFAPSEPKIEPGDCIEWIANTVQHSSSDNACPTAATCGAASPPACLWDSGNVDSAAADPAAICHYNTTDWPGPTDDPFYCRIHATPDSGTMRGVLHVTTAIELTVDKSGDDVRLTWTGGGLPADETFDVVRSTDDPTFPTASTTTTVPNDGARAHNDTNELLGADDRYYLVVNRN